MKCASCHTLNPAEARFCFHCGTQIETSPKSGFSFDIPREIQSVQTWAYFFVRKLPMPYWVSILLFWQLLLAGDYALCNIFGIDEMLIFNLCLYGAFAGTAIAIEYCKREMQRFYPRLRTFVSEPEDFLKDWYFKRLRKSYFSKSSFFFGLGMVLLGSFSIYEIALEKSFYVSEITYYRIFTSGIGFFFVGTGVWSIFSIILLTNQLSRFRIHVKLLALGDDSVMAMGTLFLRMSLAIAGVYALVVAADILAGVITSFVILIWNGVAVISILAFFIIPQYRIHKIMIREKQKRLQSFTGFLEQTMNESLREPSIEKLQHLRELFELREHLSGMHEWTFRSGAISQLISVLIIPLLLVLLEVYMSK